MTRRSDAASSTAVRRRKRRSDKQAGDGHEIVFPDPVADTTPVPGDDHPDDIRRLNDPAVFHPESPRPERPRDVFTDDDEDDDASAAPVVIDVDAVDGGDAQRLNPSSSLHRHHYNNPHSHQQRHRNGGDADGTVLESLRGDSFLRTNIGPMFGPLHHGSVAAVLRRPTHHHDDETVVFRNGKLNVLRSRWILCYAHATIEDEYYVFAQEHRGGAIATCFVAAALIFLGNAVYAIITELTALAFALYGASVLGFLIAGTGIKWLYMDLQALRLEYGLGDPLDGNVTSVQTPDPSSPSDKNNSSGGVAGHRAGGELRGFQNSMPLLVRDSHVAARDAMKPPAPNPLHAMPSSALEGERLANVAVGQPSQDGPEVGDDAEHQQQQQQYCWRRSFRRNAAFNEVFAMVGIFSCFLYSIGNMSGRVCNVEKYGEEDTLRVCNGVVQSDATYLFALVAVSFLMPVRFFLFVPLYIIMTVAYFGFKKATFIVPITNAAFWTSMVIMGTELCIALIVRYLKESAKRDEYEVFLQLHLKMLEAGHIRLLTEKMVSAHVPLKAARSMLLQQQQLQQAGRGNGGGAAEVLTTAGGMFAWNSKRAVTCTLSVGGFSEWAALRSSLDAVELLQGLFQRFDQLREQSAPLAALNHNGGNNAGATTPLPPPSKYHSFGDTFTAMYLDCRDDKDLVEAVRAMSTFAVRALRGGQDLIAQEYAANRFSTAEVFGCNERERQERERLASSSTQQLRTICHLDVGSCGGAFCNISKTICPTGPLATVTPLALSWLHGSLKAHQASIGDTLFARSQEQPPPLDKTTKESAVAMMAALVCSKRFISVLLRSNDAALPSLAGSLSRSADGGSSQPFLLLDADTRADPQSMQVATLRAAVTQMETQHNWMHVVRQQQSIAHQRSRHAEEFSLSHSNPLAPPSDLHHQEPSAAVAVELSSPPLVPFRLPEGPITTPHHRSNATLSNRILLALHPFDTINAFAPQQQQQQQDASLRVTALTQTNGQNLSTASAPGEGGGGPANCSNNSHQHTPRDIQLNNSLPQFSSTEVRSPVYRSPRDAGGVGVGGGTAVEYSGSSQNNAVGATIALWPSSSHPQSHHQHSSTTGATVPSDATTILRTSTEDDEGSSKPDDAGLASSTKNKLKMAPIVLDQHNRLSPTHHHNSRHAGSDGTVMINFPVNDDANDSDGNEDDEDGDEISAQVEDPMVTATKRVSLSFVGRYPPWNFLYRFDDPLTEEAYITSFRTVLQPQELLLSTAFSAASFVALIGVCALDSDTEFYPIVRRPLPWLVFGLIACFLSGAVTLLANYRHAPISRFVHVTLSIVVQVLYVVGIAAASANRHNINGVSQIGDAQLLWLYVMLNWAVNRPTATHPLWMTLRDVLLCGFFIFRTAFWFDAAGAPRLLYYYLYAAYIFVVGTIRVLGDAARRYNFATSRLVEYLRDELQNDYGRLYKSLDLMVPAGMAGRLTQKARRANARKLRWGWATVTPQHHQAQRHSGGDEDIDDGSMRPLRIYGLLSNSFATSIQDTSFLVLDLQPQLSHRSGTPGHSVRDAYTASVLESFQLLELIHSSLCATGKRYHLRVECVKATATRSFWCAHSTSRQKAENSEDDENGDAVEGQDAADHASDGAPSSQQTSCHTPRKKHPHHHAAKTPNNSGGTVSRNRSLLRFAIRATKLIIAASSSPPPPPASSPPPTPRDGGVFRTPTAAAAAVTAHVIPSTLASAKVRMFLHCGPIVGAVAGGRCVSFEFYGAPSQLALDCIDHIEWNTIALSDRFDTSCHFAMPTLPGRRLPAAAAAGLRGDARKAAEAMQSPQGGHDDEDLLTAVGLLNPTPHTGSATRAEEGISTMLPPPSPLFSVHPLPTPTTAMTPTTSAYPPPPTRMAVKLRGYPFPIPLRCLNVTTVAAAVPTTTAVRASVTKATTTTTTATPPFNHNNKTQQLATA